MQILVVFRNLSAELVSLVQQTLREVNIYDRLINPESVAGSRSWFACKQTMWNQAKSAIVDTPTTFCVITHLRDRRSLI